MSLADMAPAARFGLQADNMAREVPAGHQTLKREESLRHLQTCRQTNMSEPSSKAKATSHRAAGHGKPASGWGRPSNCRRMGEGSVTADKTLGQQGNLSAGLCEHDRLPV